MGPWHENLKCVSASVSNVTHSKLLKYRTQRKKNSWTEVPQINETRHFTFFLSFSLRFFEIIKYTGLNTPELSCYHYVHFLTCSSASSFSARSCAPSCWNPTIFQSPILSCVLCDRPQSTGAQHCDFLLPRAQSFAEVGLTHTTTPQERLTLEAFYILTSASAFRQVSPPSYLHEKIWTAEKTKGIRKKQNRRLKEIREHTGVSTLPAVRQFVNDAVSC